MDESEFALYEHYEVTCARCGAVGTTATYFLEEGDEWECPPCYERCEAQERTLYGRPSDAKDGGIT